MSGKVVELDFSPAQPEGINPSILAVPSHDGRRDGRKRLRETRVGPRYSKLFEN